MEMGYHGAQRPLNTFIIFLIFSYLCQTALGVTSSDTPSNQNPKIDLTTEQRKLRNDDNDDDVNSLSGKREDAKNENRIVTSVPIPIILPRVDPAQILNPSIETPNGEHIFVGETIEVICTTEQRNDVEFKLDIENPLGEAIQCKKLQEQNATTPNRVDCMEGVPRVRDVNKKSWYKNLIIQNARKEDSGIYKCILTVFVHSGKHTRFRNATVHVHDFHEKFLEAFAEKEAIQVERGETGRWIMHISSLPKNFSITLKNPKGEEVKENEKIRFSKIRDYQERYKLEIFNVQLDDNGTYSLTLSLPGQSDTPETINLHLNVLASPTVMITNVKNFLAYEMCELRCDATGNPPPVISWTFQECKSESRCMNPEKILDAIETTVGFTTTSRIRFKATQDKNYTCYGENRIGSTMTGLFVRDVGYQSRILSIFVVGAVLFLVATVAIFGIVRYHRLKRKRRKTRILQEEFYKGSEKDYNPNLSVTEQASLLSFDKKKVFPEKKLTLVEKIGEGNFGIVYKGIAKDIVEPGVDTIVAVKINKDDPGGIGFKASKCEVKIMAHSGENVNVAKLLGAITTHLAKRKLIVIVEYCQHGSILDYMRRHRSSFVNELVQNVEINDENNSSGNDQPRRAHYSQLVYTERERVDGEEENEEGQPATPTLVSIDPRGRRCVYTSLERRGDQYYIPEDERNLPPITTTDLVGWAIQIANGMEHLASKEIVHCDLSCRNVLLAEGNVVKICDFGLAMELYRNIDYRRRIQEGGLPIKWMAIESIFDRKFSTKSDAWSFGVVLSELFTLGNEPYPGMAENWVATIQFCRWLNEGNRMEKPEYAPNAVYDIMRECWSHDPNDRPNFSDLVVRLGEMLPEDLRNLNAPYEEVSTVRSSEEVTQASVSPTPSGYQNLPNENEPVCTILVNNASYSLTYSNSRRDTDHDQQE